MSRDSEDDPYSIPLRDSKHSTNHEGDAFLGIDVVLRGNSSQQLMLVFLRHLTQLYSARSDPDQLHVRSEYVQIVNIIVRKI